MLSVMTTQDENNQSTQMHLIIHLRVQKCTKNLSSLNKIVAVLKVLKKIQFFSAEVRRANTLALQ